MLNLCVQSLPSLFFLLFFCNEPTSKIGFIAAGGRNTGHLKIPVHKTVLNNKTHGKVHGMIQKVRKRQQELCHKTEKTTRNNRLSFHLCNKLRKPRRFYKYWLPYQINISQRWVPTTKNDIPRDKRCSKDSNFYTQIWNISKGSSKGYKNLHLQPLWEWPKKWILVSSINKKLHNQITFLQPFSFALLTQNKKKCPLRH